MVDSKTNENHWEKRFISYFTDLHTPLDDASHDLSHFRRVYKMAKEIATYETSSIDPFVIMAAAYFHDVVSLPKHHPDSKISSQLAAIKAKQILTEMCFPKEKIDPVCHAIEAHSFSANIPPQTLEAKIIQDADRMESLGALGILRTFYVSGRMGTTPYDKEDLHAERRPLNDKMYGLDHFQCKLFKLPTLLQTKGGRLISEKRADFLRYFVDELQQDLHEGDGGAMSLVWSCVNAGQENHKLFDELDPLAAKRPLNPSKFVVDRLITFRNQHTQFSNKFLTQLEQEIY